MQWRPTARAAGRGKSIASINRGMAPRSPRHFSQSRLVLSWHGDASAAPGRRLPTNRLLGSRPMPSAMLLPTSATRPSILQYCLPCRSPVPILTRRSIPSHAWPALPCPLLPPTPRRSASYAANISLRQSAAPTNLHYMQCCHPIWTRLFPPWERPWSLHKPVNMVLVHSGSAWIGFNRASTTQMAETSITPTDAFRLASVSRCGSSTGRTKNAETGWMLPLTLDQTQRSGVHHLASHVCPHADPAARVWRQHIAYDILQPASSWNPTRLIRLASPTSHPVPSHTLTLSRAHNTNPCPPDFLTCTLFCSARRLGIAPLYYRRRYRPRDLQRTATAPFPSPPPSSPVPHPISPASAIDLAPSCFSPFIVLVLKLLISEAPGISRSLLIS